jgi:hypothetical protein
LKNDQVKISILIKPTWNLVKEVQIKAETFMRAKKMSSDIIDAAIMCSTELIENAVKYGAEKPDGSSIEFDLHASEDLIEIVVSNGYHTEKDLQNVIEHIDKIKTSNDPAALYVERLQELLDNPKPGVSQLGLYRIFYEGGFSLDYRHENKILTIIAKREI